MSVILILFLIGVSKCAPDGRHWNYESEGPDFWKQEFSNCKGQRQSPIDISKDFLEYDSNLKQFIFYNYEKDSIWNVSHNGHTVVVSNINEDEFKIFGSDFDEKFKLLQFHFHWGHNNYQGSEHLIDGEKFPLEMHLVHKSKSGEFTVLGFLFKLSEENNDALDSLLQGVGSARKKGQWQNVTFSLSSFLPDLDKLNYYRYLGSLTTPPCTEGVIWNVVTSYIDISPKQLAIFRTTDLKLNFRDPQKIYNRQVFTSFEVKNKAGARSRSDQQCVIPNDSQNSKRIFAINGILTIAFIALFNIF